MRSGAWYDSSNTQLKCQGVGQIVLKKVREEERNDRTKETALEYIPTTLTTGSQEGETAGDASNRMGR